MKEKRKVISVSLNSEEYANYKMIIDSLALSELHKEHMSESMKMKYLLSFVSKNLLNGEKKVEM